MAGIEVTPGAVDANMGFRTDELTRVAFPGKFKTYA